MYRSYDDVDPEQFRYGLILKERVIALLTGRAITLLLTPAFFQPEALWTQSSHLPGRKQLGKQWQAVDYWLPH